MEYRRAISDLEIQKCQNLLKEVYIEEYNYPLVIPDKYDKKSSTYMYCECQGEIASTMRIVVPDPIGMPMEEVFQMPGLESGIRYGEISRIAVKDKFRGKVLHANIYADVCRTGKELGLTHFVAEVNLSLVTLYKRFFCYKPMGPAMCDPDMVKKPEDEGKANFMPMIGSIDAFLERFIRSQFTQGDLVDMALEISKYKGLTVERIVSGIKTVA